MAVRAGNLGEGTLLADQWQKAYECAAPAIAATFTVSFCNKNEGEARVWIAHGPGPEATTPGMVCLEYNAQLDACEPLERTGLVISQGRMVFVKSNAANVDFSVYGFEKEAG